MQWPRSRRISQRVTFGLRASHESKSELPHAVGGRPELSSHAAILLGAQELHDLAEAGLFVKLEAVLLEALPEELVAPLDPVGVCPKAVEVVAVEHADRVAGLQRKCRRAVLDEPMTVQLSELGGSLLVQLLHEPKAPGEAHRQRGRHRVHLLVLWQSAQRNSLDLLEARLHRLLHRQSFEPEVALHLLRHAALVEAVFDVALRAVERLPVRDLGIGEALEGPQVDSGRRPEATIHSSAIQDETLPSLLLRHGESSHTPEAAVRESRQASLAQHPDERHAELPSFAKPVVTVHVDLGGPVAHQAPLVLVEQQLLLEALQQVAGPTCQYFLQGNGCPSDGGQRQGVQAEGRDVANRRLPTVGRVGTPERAHDSRGSDALRRSAESLAALQDVGMGTPLREGGLLGCRSQRLALQNAHVEVHAVEGRDALVGTSTRRCPAFKTAADRPTEEPIGACRGRKQWQREDVALSLLCSLSRIV